MLSQEAMMGMQQELADRAALVTGGASGIRRLIALSFAQEGANHCYGCADLDQRTQGHGLLIW